jgi:hypothetical protein
MCARSDGHLVSRRGKPLVDGLPVQPKKGSPAGSRGRSVRMVRGNPRECIRSGDENPIRRDFQSGDGRRLPPARSPNPERLPWTTSSQSSPERGDGGGEAEGESQRVEVDGMGAVRELALEGDADLAAGGEREPVIGGRSSVRRRRERSARSRREW